MRQNKRSIPTICASAVTLLAAATALTACSRPGDEAGGGLLTIKGSDTMVHLVTHWAEAYMETHEDRDISVTGGGSGTGIAAIINGTGDMCMASREMKPQELEDAKARGIVPEEHIVALDGIAVVVHPDNPVETLSMDQLEAIFTGDVKNWSEVGGRDEEILVLSRESSSGTYVFFKEHVLQKRDFAPSALLLPATSGIIRSVSEDTTAVGYVGLGYAEEAGGQVKVLSVKPGPDAEPVTPTQESVKSGEYAISRGLNLYSKSDASQLARDFIDFALSEEGQAIVREEGYVPVSGSGE